MVATFKKLHGDKTILEDNKKVSTSEHYDLNVFFDFSDDVLCIVSSNGIIEKANQLFCKISGQTGLELVGQRFESLIHPDDRSHIKTGFFNITSRQSQEFTARIQNDNSGKTFLWKIKLVDTVFYLTAKVVNQASSSENQGGENYQNREKINQSNTVKDLSLNKCESQTVPNQSQFPNAFKSDYRNEVEHRLKILSRNSTDLLAIVSEKGLYQYISTNIERISGMDPEYYNGKNIFEFIHPDDIATLTPLFKSILNNFKVELPPYRFMSSDGNWHWLETVLTNLLHDPSITGIVCNSRDVTSQKETANDTFRDTRRLSNLIEHNNDGSFTLGRNWKFISFNAVFKSTKGLPKDVQIGTNFFEVFPRAVSTKYYTEFSRAFEDNVPVRFSDFSPLFNRWFEVNAYPFEDTLTVIVRDISKLKMQQLTSSLEKEVMEMNISSKYNLKEIVDFLLSGVEKIYSGMTCSVLELDPQTKKISHLSAPKLPPEYTRLVNGTIIGPQAGSCGTAAFLKKPVVVSDIETHPYWKSYKDFVLPLGLKSCWSFPVLNSEGKVLAIFGIYHSEIKVPSVYEYKALQRVSTILQMLIENYRNKKEIEISQERYRLTNQATSDSIWDYDILKKKVYRGNGFGKYFNQQVGFEDINLGKWEHNVHPEDVERAEKSLNDCLQDANSNYWTEEYRYLKNDKTYASVIDKGYIVRNSEKKAIRVVGALQDITEIKKNQDQLKQSQENYKNMFTHNPTPMWTYDLKTHCFTMVNDAALELYGYTRNEFLMLNLFSIRVKEEHEKLREMLKIVELQQSKKFTNEWTHLKKNGSKIIVDVVSHPVLIYGRRSRLVAIHDVTEKKKARQEILDQNQRLKEIAQISSHETRKPLASILGLVSIFDKKNPGSPLNKEIIQYLEISASELDKVIHSIVKKTWLEASASSETDALN